MTRPEASAQRALVGRRMVLSALAVSTLGLAGCFGLAVTGAAVGTMAVAPDAIDRVVGEPVLLALDDEHEVAGVDAWRHQRGDVVRVEQGHLGQSSGSGSAGSAAPASAAFVDARPRLVGECVSTG